MEFGILKGNSLESILGNIGKESQIKAYDIFEDFNGNAANLKKLKRKFKKYKNLTIEYANFYEKHNDLKNNSLDLIHVDIANDGNVYDFFIKNYFKKLKNDGIGILEGGSKKEILLIG